MRNKQIKRAIIVQARIGSTRLPRKLILKLNGDTVIEFLLKRLKHVPMVDKLILATTNLKEDDRIVDLVKQLKIDFYRGSSTDVLKRFYDVTETFDINVVVRICGDNPFIEISEIIRLLNEQKRLQCDYISNCLSDKTPLILTGTGLAVEVFTRRAIEKMVEYGLDSYHREHVTPFFYENPNLFSIIYSVIPFNISKDIRLTLDTPEDFDNIKQIYHDLKPEINISKIIDYLKHRLDIKQTMINLAKLQAKGRKV